VDVRRLLRELKKKSIISKVVTRTGKKRERNTEINI